MFGRIMGLMALIILASIAPASAVGFQWAAAPDAEGEPLKVAIWYPSTASPQTRQIGPFEMNIALDAPVSGHGRGLIVMSHGTGGSAVNSYDTAMALAEAGYIVAAVAHTGDNYQDQSASFSSRNFVNRPRHITRVLDYLLHGWIGHDVIDPKKIGFFGHSAGGTTGLIAGGGVADWSKALAFCTLHPKDWGCRKAAERGLTSGNDTPTAGGVPDRRIKAMALATPALIHVFEPNGLKAFTPPVQVWVSGKDEVVTNAAAVRPLLTHGLSYHLVPDAGHFAFLAPCNEILRGAAPEICADPRGFDRARFLKRFQRELIAFYRRTVK